MIVTRRRRKRFPWKRVLIPAGVIVALVSVLAWTPSRTWIATGPAAPMWRSLQPAWKRVSDTFSPIVLQQSLRSRDSEIAKLQKQIAAAQAQVARRDAQISQLQAQLSSAQQDAARARAVKSAALPTAATASSGILPSAVRNANDLASQATPDIRRTAAVWSAMDASAAAKIVQRLPDDYVARVFAVMSPDAVGAILESLPPSYAARLTQDHPELRS